RSGVNVIATVIGMPDFDESAFDGIAAAIENAPGKVGDFATGAGEAVVQVNEVVIFIQRDVVGERIVRALGQLRRKRESLRKIGGQGKTGGVGGNGFQELAAFQGDVKRLGFGGDDFIFHRSGWVFCSGSTEMRFKKRSDTEASRRQDRTAMVVTTKTMAAVMTRAFMRPPFLFPAGTGEIPRNASTCAGNFGSRAGSR